MSLFFFEIFAFRALIPVCFFINQCLYSYQQSNTVVFAFLPFRAIVQRNRYFLPGSFGWALYSQTGFKMEIETGF